MHSSECCHYVQHFLSYKESENNNGWKEKVWCISTFLIKVLPNLTSKKRQKVEELQRKLAEHDDVRAMSQLKSSPGSDRKSPAEIKVSVQKTNPTLSWSFCVASKAKHHIGMTSSLSHAMLLLATHGFCRILVPCVYCPQRWKIQNCIMISHDVKNELLFNFNAYNF